jgi:hypothetical protein
LRFIEEDEALVQGSSPHVGEGCHFNHAPFNELGNGGGIEHVVQSVIERTQVGEHFLLQVAGEESQGLTGFHRRPGENDAVDFSFQQG